MRIIGICPSTRAREVATVVTYLFPFIEHPRKLTMSPTEPSASNAFPSAAENLLKLCDRLGIDYIFANFGSDHPGFIEALAILRQRGESAPQVIVCPHEMTALSAAHGYAMVTRRPQLVLVHVDVGTQNLGGSVHNIARGRVPVVIVAGLSPLGEGRDSAASRTEYIHYIQDTSRQHEIVAQYMKWSYEVRAADMTRATLLRAWQIAESSPQGPTYITGARELWDAADTSAEPNAAACGAASLGGLPDAALHELHEALAGANRALVVTTYLGRNPDSVRKLVSMCERYGVGVLEVGPQYMNFPGEHPCHLGYRRDSMVDQADVILLIDVDVPWLPRNTRPASSAKVFHIDVDALKPALGAWHFGAHSRHVAESGIALDQLLNADLPVEPVRREARLAWLASASVRRTPELPTEGPISAVEVTLAVRKLVSERTIVLCEEPSNALGITSILRMSRPGSFFASGGSGLGWGTNAAIGAQLAAPDAEVIALVGDGCFLFGVPSSTYWVAGKYETPVLTVIYNNGGWHSPKVSTQLVHGEGIAHREDTYWVSAGAGARLAELAAATGGAAAFRVTDRELLHSTLKEAMATVRAGRAAVVEVLIQPITGQALGIGN
ncbi:Acetolactate synthase large subunit [Burkholderia sp. OK233]|nr:Acetolactate synthase large subunit [Burkholderia sp. OK233]